MTLNERVDFLISEKIKNNQYRSLFVAPNINEMIDFSHNDYLLLSKNKEVIENGMFFIQKYGSGGQSSRSLGVCEIYTKLEDCIAKCKKKENSITFSSGYIANSSSIKAILDLYKDDEIEIFSDKLNHFSILQGIALSGKRQTRYKNIDLNHLEILLKKSTKKHKIVITESVFSMDGTIVNIDNLIELKRKYNFILYLDEAHSFGLYGKNGYGISEKYADEIEFLMGTCSKAVGSQGGYLASSKKIHDYLINFASGFIFSTAPNPSSIGVSLKAIEFIPTLHNERVKLFENADYLRSFFTNAQTCNSSANIIPILIKDENLTMKCKNDLFENGIMAAAVRYPAVPFGLSRIRVSLNISHTKNDIDKLVNITKRYVR